MKQANVRAVAEVEDRALDSLARSDADNESASPGDDFAPEIPRNWRIYIVAYNRLLRETLGKLLSKRSDLQVVGQSAATPDIVKELLDTV